jgi:GNAT superfamily N-acetyltransferase
VPERSDPERSAPERSNSAIRLRVMTVADIPAGLELCRAARWNQIEADWRRFLALHPMGARVAVDTDDAVIGSVATLRYDGGFDWLAMVLVAPAYRRQGVASRLVEEALDLLGARAPVRLDATPAGELVYRTLAFVPEYTLARMERLPEVSAEPAPDDAVRAMDDEDLPEVLALDRDVFGADRAALLRTLRQEAPGYAIVDRRGSRLEGYAFGRHGFSCDQLGPIIARDERAARRLVGHVVASHPRVAFLLDVPRRSAAWVAWLGDIGFREQRGFVRLVRGAPAGLTSTGSERRLFATIGADFG